MNAEVHGLSGAYAADAIDAQEREAFERHLAECAECREEVTSLQEATAMLSTLTPIDPPAALRTSVLEGIRSVRPLPPLVDPSVTVVDTATAPDPAATEPIGPRHAAVIPLQPRRRAVKWMAGLAAAAAIAVGTVVWSPWDNGAPQQTFAQQVQQAGDAQRVSETINGANATIVRSPSLKGAVLVADNLPAVPGDKVYQLWYNVPGTGYVSAGVLPKDTSGPVAFVLKGDASKATLAGITTEPAGGSSQPTSLPIAAFKFA